MKFSELSEQQMAWVRVACIAYAKKLITNQTSLDVLRFIWYRADELPVIPDSHPIMQSSRHL